MQNTKDLKQAIPLLIQLLNAKFKTFITPVELSNIDYWSTCFSNLDQVPDSITNDFLHTVEIIRNRAEQDHQQNMKMLQQSLAMIQHHLTAASDTTSTPAVTATTVTPTAPITFAGDLPTAAAAVGGSAVSALGRSVATAQGGAMAAIAATPSTPTTSVPPVTNTPSTTAAQGIDTVGSQNTVATTITSANANASASAESTDTEPQPTTTAKSKLPNSKTSRHEYMLNWTKRIATTLLVNYDSLINTEQRQFLLQVAEQGTTSSNKIQKIRKEIEAKAIEQGYAVPKSGSRIPSQEQSIANNQNTAPLSNATAATAPNASAISPSNTSTTTPEVQSPAVAASTATMQRGKNTNGSAQTAQVESSPATVATAQTSPDVSAASAVSAANTVNTTSTANATRTVSPASAPQTTQSSASETQELQFMAEFLLHHCKQALSAMEARTLRMQLKQNACDREFLSTLMQECKRRMQQRGLDMPDFEEELKFNQAKAEAQSRLQNVSDYNYRSTNARASEPPQNVRYQPRQSSYTSPSYSPRQSSYNPPYRSNSANTYYSGSKYNQNASYAAAPTPKRYVGTFGQELQSAFQQNQMAESNIASSSPVHKPTTYRSSPYKSAASHGRPKASVNTEDSASATEKRYTSNTDSQLERSKALAKELISKYSKELRKTESSFLSNVALVGTDNLKALELMAQNLESRAAINRRATGNRR